MYNQDNSTGRPWPAVAESRIGDMFGVLQPRRRTCVLTVTQRLLLSGALLPGTKRQHITRLRAQFHLGTWTVPAEMIIIFSVDNRPV